MADTMIEDMQARYQEEVEALRDRAFYPPVRVVLEGTYPVFECANGHRYGTVTQPPECFQCRSLHDFRVASRPECSYERCHTLVTCSDRAFQAGVRTCRLHHETEQISRVHFGPICLDELVTVMAQYTDQRWNGWLVPRIDAWAVNHVMSLLDSDIGSDPDCGYDWRWDDEGNLVLEDRQYRTEYPEDFQPEVHAPDEDGLYSLGAFSWTWSEDTSICGVLVNELPCVRNQHNEGDHDTLRSSY